MGVWEMENPGAGGRTGAAWVNCKSDDFVNIRYFLKYQAICRLYFLTLLIPDDSHFEMGLSLGLDRALMAVEGGV